MIEELQTELARALTEGPELPRVAPVLPIEPDVVEALAAAIGASIEKIVTAAVEQAIWRAVPDAVEVAVSDLMPSRPAAVGCAAPSTSWPPPDASSAPASAGSAGDRSARPERRRPQVGCGRVL